MKEFAEYILNEEDLTQDEKFLRYQLLPWMGIGDKQQNQHG